MKFILTFIVALSHIYSYGQEYIQYDYIPTSILKDGLHNQYGSGNMQILSGGYNIPLSMKYNDEKQPIIWKANVRLAYSTLANQGQAQEFNPDNIFNGSLNLTHIRPISRKWSFVASVGGGIYAPTHEISTKSILANGRIVFIYKLNKNLSLGTGIGLTNSYGIPMVMPMIYLNWQKTGKYEFKIDVSSGLKMSSSVWLNRLVKLELVAFEADGMSAVMNIKGKSQIYSIVMLKSYMCPSFQLSKHMEFYMNLGGNWLRGIKMSERNLKGFLNAQKSDNEEENLRFDVVLQTSAGFRFKF